MFTMDDLYPGGDVATFSEEQERGGAHEELSRDVGLKGLLPVLVLASQQVLQDRLSGREIRFGVGREASVVVAGDAGLGAVSAIRLKLELELGRTLFTRRWIPLGSCLVTSVARRVTSSFFVMSPESLDASSTAYLDSAG